MHQVSRSWMHCCKGITITVPISALCLCSVWDHCIVFNFSHVWANTATGAQLMHTNLQGWGYLVTYPNLYFSTSTLLQVSKLLPFLFFSISFQDCSFFLGLFEKTVKFFLLKNQCLVLQRPFTNAVQCCCWEQPPLATFSLKTKITSPLWQFYY